MTIKELEVRSGIPRATIRYYEQVGLLKPLREPNGYRDYSEADLAALEKILLLRELQLPLEEIRALQAGEKSLDESLSAQLQILEQQSAGLQRAQLLCRTLLEEKVSFQALDAAACLRRLKESAPENRPSPVLAADTAPASPPHPWRRYFARAIDLLLYGTVWSAVLMLGFRVNITGLSLFLNWLSNLVPLFMMLFLEPLMLRFWGYTPGKWIFGLRLTDENGRRLGYAAALVRTWKVIWYGLALGIPIWNLVRLLKCRRRCLDEAEQPWDEEGEFLYTLDDENGWRALACFGAYALLIFATVLLVLFIRLPPNRGELTVEDFAENYNIMADTYNADICYLDETGRFIPNEKLGWPFFNEIPDLEFQTEGGFITAISWTVENELTSSEYWSAPAILQSSTLAFVGAQPDCNLFHNPAISAAQLTGKVEDCHFTSAGVDIRVEETLNPETNRFSLRFTMALTD